MRLNFRCTWGWAPSLPRNLFQRGNLRIKFPRTQSREKNSPPTFPALVLNICGSNPESYPPGSDFFLFREISSPIFWKTRHLDGSWSRKNRGHPKRSCFEITCDQPRPRRNISRISCSPSLRNKLFNFWIFDFFFDLNHDAKGTIPKSRPRSFRANKRLPPKWDLWVIGVCSDAPWQNTGLFSIFQPWWWIREYFSGFCKPSCRYFSSCKSKN